MAVVPRGLLKSEEWKNRRFIFRLLYTFNKEKGVLYNTTGPYPDSKEAYLHMASDPCCKHDSKKRRWKVKVKSFSRVQFFATPWTVAYQVLPSMGFFRQEYWSGLPFPSPGDLPTPGIKPGSPALQADSLLSEPPGKPQKDNHFYCSVTHHYFLAGV